ncbi:hypothetical protein ACFX2B_022124 [Malus domestica]
MATSSLSCQENPETKKVQFLPPSLVDYDVHVRELSAIHNLVCFTKRITRALHCYRSKRRETPYHIFIIKPPPQRHQGRKYID